MRIRKCTVLVLIMKLTVALLLLAAVTHAAKPGNLKKHNESEKTEKRELVDGNSGVEKRALLSTASPGVTTGGVEYANTKEDLADKSPAQQIYATPVPQIAKISDVLSGQGPQFQAAIASHLYSPISVYQPRLGSPTTYEVSAPVPSQLAYSEHRLSIPSPNAIQYDAKQQNVGKPLINFAQPQILFRPSHEQNLGPVFPQYSNNIQTIPQPAEYSQQQVYPAQQLQFIQASKNSPQGISFQQPPLIVKQNEPRDIKSKSVHSQELDYNGKQQNAKSYASFSFSQSPSADQAQPKVVPSQQPQLQVHSVQQNEQQQYQPIAQINYQLQHPNIILQQQPQPPQSSIQPLHTRIQFKQNPQLIQEEQPQIQYQAQPQIQYQAQPQIQYQAQPQINYQPQPQEQVQQLQYQPVQPQVVYQPQELQQQPQSLQYQQPQPYIQYQTQQEQPLHYEPQPAPYQIDPQHFLYQQPQLLPQQYQPQYDISQVQQEPKQSAIKPYFKQATLLQPQINQSSQVQNNNYKEIPALPTYPPVQYFGKFAHSIFGNNQH